MKSSLSLSVVSGSPANLRMRSNTLWQWETALLRVHIQDPLLPFGQMCPVVQHLFTRQGSGDNGRHVKGLLDFALPVDALKLPSVAMVELSIQIICGGVS